MKNNHYEESSMNPFSVTREGVKQWFLVICLLLLLLVLVYTKGLFVVLAVTLVVSLAIIIGFLVAVVTGLAYHELKWYLDADSAWIPARAFFSGFSLRLEIINSLLFPSRRFWILVTICSMINCFFFLSVALSLFNLV